MAAELEPVAAALRAELGLGEPFRDPGVGEFGLVNAVFALGDCFLEVIAPAQGGTAAGRWLERHGGDGGYMVIFDLEDVGRARERARESGIRVVWRVAPDTLRLTLSEPVVPGDPTSALPQYPTVSGYSGQGDVTGDVLYVNYGLIEDYAQLDSLGVSAQGKIVVARYGRSFRIAGRRSSCRCRQTRAGSNPGSRNRTSPAAFALRLRAAPEPVPRRRSG